MKECFKCKKILPISEYYKHPDMADGHLGKCKNCARKDSNERRKIKEKDVSWVLSEQDRHREKSKRYRDAGLYKKTSQYKKECDYRHREKYPEKYKARTLLSNAIRSGKIHRHPCCVCGAKAEAHHEDYSKPLDVIWFCSRHHAEHHVNKRKQQLQYQK